MRTIFDVGVSSLNPLHAWNLSQIAAVYDLEEGSRALGTTNPVTSSQRSNRLRYTDSVKPKLPDKVHVTTRCGVVAQLRVSQLQLLDPPCTTGSATSSA